MTKLYVRCIICLEPCVIDETTKWRTATCGACGGKFELMGFVKGFEVVQPELRCVCDNRCVNALGPHCECKCEGTNHGAGLLGYYEVDKVVGKVKLTPTNVERAKARAVEYISTLAQAKQVCATSMGTSMEQFRLGRKLREAALSRSHNHRMTILYGILGKIYVGQVKEETPKAEASDI